VSFQKFCRRSFALCFLILTTAATSAFSQTKPTPALIINRDARAMAAVAQGNNLYCAGFIQAAPIDTSYEIVGARDERDRHIFAQGDNLYINAGASRGLKVGDMFSVVRPRGRVEARPSRKRNLGFYVQEVGMVEVVNVKSSVSVVRVKTSCDNLMLGDLLQAVPQRTSPSFDATRPALDLFGEPSGKATGRIILARNGAELLGREQIVYVDLGAEDNVRVGDHLTIYRPLGRGNIFSREEHESIEARNRDYESRTYRGGRYSNQAARKSGSTAEGTVVTSENAKSRRPQRLREVVGEMVILNVKEKTATAVITRTATEIHTGDSVEIQ
jgi:hypothetical protein